MTLSVVLASITTILAITAGVVELLERKERAAIVVAIVTADIVLWLAIAFL